MPRLDNSDPELLEYFGLEFDENDPGMTEPIDLCKYCARSWLRDDPCLECEHPPYEEQWPPYKCLDCEEELTEDDD